MRLSIAHTTHYRYARPVKFGPHKLMIRAIEGHDVQIRKSGLSISVPHRIRWLYDVFGNSDYLGLDVEVHAVQLEGET